MPGMTSQWFTSTSQIAITTIAAIVTPRPVRPPANRATTSAMSVATPRTIGPQGMPGMNSDSRNSAATMTSMTPTIVEPPRARSRQMPSTRVQARRIMRNGIGHHDLADGRGEEPFGRAVREDGMRGARVDLACAVGPHCIGRLTERAAG